MKRDVAGCHELVATSRAYANLVQLPRVAGEDHDQRENVLVEHCQIDA